MPQRTREVPRLGGEGWNKEESTPGLEVMVKGLKKDVIRETIAGE